MAVTETQTPGVQPDSQAAPVQPAPSLGAFRGAAVGEGLDKIGTALFHVGWEAHMQAAEAQAQKQETKFMDVSLKLRDSYKLLSNEDAIKLHPEVTAKLAKAREDLGNALTSKHGLQVYNTNTLRNTRIVQEHIDQHFEAQNKSYQLLQFKNAQHGDAELLGALGDVGHYSADEVDKVAEAIEARTFAFADSHGIDDETAEQMANADVQKGTDMLFKRLMAQKRAADPVLVKRELDRLSAKDWVHPNVQSRVIGQLGSTGVISDVNKIIAASERLSFKKGVLPDLLHGPMNPEEINQAVEERIKTNPEQADLYRSTTAKILTANKKLVEDTFEQRINQLDGNGGWKNTDNADIVQALERDTATKFKLYQKQAELNEIRKHALATKNQKETSRSNLKSFLNQISEMESANPAMLKDFKPSRLNEVSLEPSDYQIAKRALEHAQKLQQGPKDKFSPTSYIKAMIASETTDPSKRAAAYGEIVAQMHEQGLSGATAKELDPLIQRGLVQVNRGLFSGKKLQVQADAEERRARRNSGVVLPAPKPKTGPVKIEIELGPDGEPRIKGGG